MSTLTDTCLTILTYIGIFHLWDAFWLYICLSCPVYVRTHIHIYGFFYEVVKLSRHISAWLHIYRHNAHVSVQMEVHNPKVRYMSGMSRHISHHVDIWRAILFLHLQLAVLVCFCKTCELRSWHTRCHSSFNLTNGWTRALFVPLFSTIPASFVYSLLFSPTIAPGDMNTLPPRLNLSLPPGRPSLALPCLVMVLHGHGLGFLLLRELALGHGLVLRLRLRTHVWSWSASSFLSCALLFSD